MRTLSSKRRCMRNRRGVAAVEFSICLPVLALLLIGSIEFANAIFLRQAITLAAYEASQIATGIGGTETAAKTRGQEVLAGYDIVDGEITVTPSITADTAPLTEVTVTVSVPANSNSVGINRFLDGKNIQKSVTMSRL